jgi:hypothetical protein
MSTRTANDPLEETHSAIDPRAGLPPAEIGAALRGVDTVSRGVMAFAWIAAALQARSVLGSTILAGLALLSLLGVAPRGVTVVGTAFAAWIAAAAWGAGAALGLVALGALRLRLHLGGAGRWLRDVRHLERRRAAALVATGLARARPEAITLAGDRYEEEGRLRAALASRGAQPAALVSLCDASARAGRALARWPKLLAAIERAALRWAE